jgi:hypothetical protein
MASIYLQGVGGTGGGGSGVAFIIPTVFERNKKAKYRIYDLPTNTAGQVFLNQMELGQSVGIQILGTQNETFHIEGVLQSPGDPVNAVPTYEQSLYCLFTSSIFQLKIAFGNQFTEIFPVALENVEITHTGGIPYYYTISFDATTLQSSGFIQTNSNSLVTTTAGALNGGRTGSVSISSFSTTSGRKLIVFGVAQNNTSGTMSVSDSLGNAFSLLQTFNGQYVQIMAWVGSDNTTGSDTITVTAGTSTATVSAVVFEVQGWTSGLYNISTQDTSTASTTAVLQNPITILGYSTCLLATWTNGTSISTPPGGFTTLTSISPMNGSYENSTTYQQSNALGETLGTSALWAMMALDLYN